jgi:hypothetical protein
MMNYFRCVFSDFYDVEPGRIFINIYFMTFK